MVGLEGSGLNAGDFEQCGDAYGDSADFGSAGAEALQRFHCGPAASWPESSFPVNISSFALRMPMMRGRR